MTVRYWLSKLPEPYRSQALANARREGLLDASATNMVVALRSAFPWKSSPEGLDYWVAICRRLEFIFGKKTARNEHDD